MTICIALLCEQGKAVVVASDRMVSGSDIEFEQNTMKIDELSNSSLALTAGSAIEHVDLLRECISVVNRQSSLGVYQIAETVKDSFARLRIKRAEETSFKPLGLDVQTFLQSQSSLSPDFVLRLTRSLEVAELDLEHIIAGVDQSGGHIYLVEDPGISSCFDALGFCCIGSGQHHATMTFVRAGYSPSTPLRNALYLAYQAKRDAEVAPGVGSRFTDLAYVTAEKGIVFCPEDLMKRLETVYGKNRQYVSDALKDANKEIQGLTL